MGDQAEETRRQEFAALIDFEVGSGLTEPLYFEHPERLLVAAAPAEVPDVLQCAERAALDGGHVAGFVTYEAAPAFDGAMAVRSERELPLACFGVFASPSSPPPLGSYAVYDWTPDVDDREYRRRIAAIREMIRAGSVYQVNYTYRLRADFEGDPYSWYVDLMRECAAPYGAFCRLGSRSILSLSPELFFATDGSRITTKPMKGTRPRGRWRLEDEANCRDLAASEKDRAENLMIVDLMRNDLGRIAETGSVRVDELFRVETFPTVLQMTSTVSAELRAGVGLAEIMAGIFPGGSITGAPKISAMQAISDLESSSRGIYCGSIGYLRPGGSGVFNMAIRTVAVDETSGCATVGVGGGITWDSRDAEELEESLVKARFLTARTPVFDLLETMKLEEGRYFLLERHLARVRESADYFGFVLNAERLLADLDVFASSHAQGRWRVRVTIARDGAVTIEAAALTSTAPATFRLSATPVDPTDRFLYHKTTHRDTYESRRREHPDADDVLLQNHRGELTEFTVGNLVVSRGGTLITPPVECGLLPGTFRAQLLADGILSEGVLSADDIGSAESVWLINSVRGWAPMRPLSQDGNDHFPASVISIEPNTPGDVNDAYPSVQTCARREPQ